MLAAHHRIRGTPIAGRRGHDPLTLSLHLLAAQVLAQALRDAKKGEHSWDRQSAMDWLNSPVGRGIADALDLDWASDPRPLTPDRLPARTPAYFRGD